MFALSNNLTPSNIWSAGVRLVIVGDGDYELIKPYQSEFQAGFIPFRLRLVIEAYSIHLSTFTPILLSGSTPPWG